MPFQPSPDLKDFTVVLANAEQLEQHARAAMVPWGRGRSFEQFIEITRKEKREAEWALDDGLLLWVLVRRDDTSGEIYSGCETYRRQALFKKRGTDHVQESWAYGIASVVTPKQHLRKGYCTHFLRLLHYVLGDPDNLPPFPSEWGTPPPTPSAKVPRAVASILWSDIGSSFYERCTVGIARPGWVVQDDQCQEVVWKILPSIDTESEDQAWQLLYPSDMTALGQELHAEYVTSLNSEERSKSSSLRLDPANPGTLGFVPGRGEMNAARTDPGPHPCGARKGDTVVLFTANNTNIGARLLVTMVHKLQSSDLPSLLRVLDKAAAPLERKEGWTFGLDATSELVDAWKGIVGRDVIVQKRAEKDGHLLGYAWYGKEEDRPDLLDTEMWCWC